MPSTCHPRSEVRQRFQCRQRPQLPAVTVGAFHLLPRRSTAQSATSKLAHFLERLESSKGLKATTLVGLSKTCIEDHRGIYTFMKTSRSWSFGMVPKTSSSNKWVAKKCDASRVARSSLTDALPFFLARLTAHCTHTRDIFWSPKCHRNGPRISLIFAVEIPL